MITELYMYVLYHSMNEKLIRKSSIMILDSFSVAFYYRMNVLS